jgi:hypothetical protein
MEAADGGRVKALLPPVRLCSLSCLLYSGYTLPSSGLLMRLCIRLLQPPQAHDVTATFVEIVGTVVDATTIKLLTCINLGSQLGGRYLIPHLTISLLT